MSSKKVSNQYREISWAKVDVRHLVYLHAKTNARGPFEVVDPKNYLLRQLSSNKTFAAVGEKLYYRNGPVVVITMDDHTMTGCYADVPLDVLLVTQSPQHGEPPSCELRRPVVLDHVPTLHEKQLTKTHKAWRSLFGLWDVCEAQQAATEELPSPTCSFNLTNKLVVVQLISAMLDAGHKMTVATIGESSWSITIPREALLLFENYGEGVIGPANPS